MRGPPDPPGTPSAPRPTIRPESVSRGNKYHHAHLNSREKIITIVYLSEPKFCPSGIHRDSHGAPGTTRELELFWESALAGTLALRGDDRELRRYHRTSIGPALVCWRIGAEAAMPVRRHAAGEVRAPTRSVTLLWGRRTAARHFSAAHHLQMRRDSGSEGFELLGVLEPDLHVPNL
jgi:hypothetical protein